MKIYEHGTGLQYFNGFLLDKFYMPKDKLLLAKNTKNKNKQNGPIDYLHKNKISLEPLSSLFLFKNLIEIHSIIINKKLIMLFLIGI